MIIRRKVNRNFTVVPNEPLNDGRLTFEALGLLVYLLSRPDHWQVQLEHLRQRGGLGREKGQALMRELIECGYRKVPLLPKRAASRRQCRRKSGRKV